MPFHWRICKWSYVANYLWSLLIFRLKTNLFKKIQQKIDNIRMCCQCWNYCMKLHFHQEHLQMCCNLRIFCSDKTSAYFRFRAIKLASFCNSRIFLKISRQNYKQQAAAPLHLYPRPRRHRRSAHARVEHPRLRSRRLRRRSCWRQQLLCWCLRRRSTKHMHDRS